MLGRNATRPLGMAPRLAALYNTAASNRIAHWISKPFTMAHMQRYLSVAPQLLLTHPQQPQPFCNNTSIISPTGSLEVTSAVCQVHTSATSLQQQHQHHQRQHQFDPLSSEKTQASSPSASDSAPASAPASVPASAFVSTSTSTTDPSAATTSGPTSVTSNGTAANPASSVPASGTAVAFNYLLAASWHPKSRNLRRTSASLSAASSSTSGSDDDEDENKVKWWKQKLRVGKVDAGEDAFFHVSTPSRVALGVADGVGGWSEVGVDPALFSWALMDNAETMARLTDNDHSDSKGGSNGNNGQKSNRIPLDAQSILDGAYKELVQSGKVQAGSSTACILSLCKMTGTLRASNLGDSAYLLIRDNKCIYESPSQQHFWNCPYQLTILPPGYPGANHHVMDTPKDAAQSTHQLQDGDVIVLATDGFWDNVFTKEAIELVERELGDIIEQSRLRRLGQTITPYQGSDSDIVGRVRALSQRLTNTARRFSLDQKRRTPFSQSARHIRTGGKIDDITVIVTLVRARSNLENA